MVLGMLAAMGTFAKDPDWRCKRLLEPIPRREGGTIIANAGDRNPPSREGHAASANLQLCCSFPFSQTLWFDLHQRLSDSESMACTVSGCWGAPAAQSHPWGGLCGSHMSHTVFGARQYLLLVRNEMTVSHKHLGEFCSSLKQYLKSVAGERDCFQWVPSAAAPRGAWGGLQ